MAAIVISSNNGLKTNPTTPFIPYNNNGVFDNSMLKMIEDNILSAYRDSINVDEDNGFFIDNGNGLYQFGDFYQEHHGSYFIINSESGDLTFNDHSNFNINFQTTGRIYIEGAECIKATAGLPANRYLSLSINGTDYKIALLNNTL
jgi:hypothetical protein